MGTKVGLWIDHKQAIVVSITEKGEKMTDPQIAQKVRQHFSK